MGKVDEARRAGYTEEEIQAHLAPKIEAARAAGYSAEEIGAHLGIKPVNHERAQKSLAQRLYSELSGSSVVGAGETAVSVATGFGAGFPAYLMGGIGGLIARHTYSPDTDPKVIATQFAEAVTYNPRSDSGKRMTDSVMHPFHLLAEFKEKQGKAVADKTGSAALAAITDETIGMLPFVVIGSLARSLKGKTPENSEFYKAADEIVETHAPKVEPVAPPAPAPAAPKVEPAAGAATPRVDPAALAAREAMKSRFAEVRAAMRPLAEKGDLTASEGAAFQRLSNEAYSLRYDLGLKRGDAADVLPAAERMSTLAPEVSAAAYNDLIRSKPAYMALSEAAAGVRFNAETAVDKVMRGENPRITAREFYDAFSGTREALRAQYGDHVTLYRATGAQREKPTTNWATTEAFAKQFGDNVVRREVPIENVIAVNTSRNGKYHEVIVGDPPARPFDAATAKEALAAKSQTIYEKTGIDPEVLKAEALQDPTVLADLASSNIEVPRAFGGKPPPPPPPPPPGQGAAAAPPPPPPAGSFAAAESAVLARVSINEKHAREFTLENLYTAAKDDLYPVAAIEKALAKGAPLEVAESPYHLARLVRGAAGKAAQFLEHGPFDFNTYRTTGPGLREILKPFEKDLTGIRAYMVARRAEELHARGIETGVPAAEARRVVADGAKYEAAFQQLQVYQNAGAKYLRDAGLVSKEGYAAMLEANKDYVPFSRLFEEPSGKNPGAGMRTHNPLMSIKGSERLIIDPIESMVKNTYLYTALAERNAVGRAFGDLVKADPAAAADLGISVVKPKLRPITLDAREIRKLFDEFVSVKSRTTRGRTETTKTTGSAAQGAEPAGKVFEMTKARVEEALTSRGFSKNEAEIMMRRIGNPKAQGGDVVIEKLVQEVVTTEHVPELNIRLPSDAAVIFRPNAMRPEPNQIRFFEDGKPITLDLPADVAAAFKATDRESAGLLLRVVAMPARTLRAGAVLTPDFMLRNVARDQLSAFTFSKTGYIPVWDMLRGATSIVKKDAVFQDWLKSGGANSALVSLDRAYLQQHLKQLNSDAGLMQRGWNVVSSPIEVLRIASELMENATRLGEFRRAGATTKAEIQAAGFASREVTLDFQRIGANTRGLNMIAAFMNAGLEGMDRTVRAFKDAPVATTAKVAASITAPSILLWTANNSTPERQARWREIPAWQRDLFWIVMTDENTYRIPKPFELGVIFGSSAERMLDKFAADKPDAMKGFTTSLLNIMSVNIMPSGAVPVLEHATNYSLFTDQPLIPRRMEGLLPEYQYRDYTTQASRALGRLIGAFPGLHDKSIASPIIIDNYIRGWTGGLGVYARDLLDYDLRKLGVLPDPPLPMATLADIPVVKAFVVRYPSASAQSVQDFYDGYAKRKQVYDTFLHLVKEGDVESAQKEAALDPTAFAKLDGINASLGTLSNVIRLVHKNPEMTPSDKRQLIDTLYGQMIVMSRAGNEAMRQVDAVLKPK